MKKAKEVDELRPEYKLSNFKSKGVRGKYYKRIMEDGTDVVLLDADVWKAFPNSEAVNDALRSVRPAKRAHRSPSGRAGRKRVAA